jgi:hypothetical protein
MALTPEGTPYVESTDLVANYPAASLSLANRIDLVGVLPFADSAARSAAIPSPTDGQYSYLQDTNSTEFWNGSAWVAAGITPGLVQINTETLSAVSSVSMTSQLSATYENYFVIWSLTSSTDSALRCRVRSGSTDNTATNYDYQYNRGSSTSTNFGNDTNQTSFLMSQILSSGGSGHCLIASPNLAQNTLFTARGGHALQFNDAQGVHDVATAFDGLTFFMASGTMTGTIRLYGYAN